MFLQLLRSQDLSFGEVKLWNFINFIFRLELIISNLYNFHFHFPFEHKKKLNK